MDSRKNGYIYYDYRKKSEKEEIAETAWKSVYHWLYFIVGVLFAVSVFFTSFGRIASVNGDSMLPTLNSGDKILVYSFFYRPEQGDIVMVTNNQEDRYPLLKRVIALEGQTVEVDYKAGTVKVDGKVLNEDYLFEKMTAESNNEITYPYTVPKNCVFLMGDNRNESQDSRNENIGCFDVRYILGKAVFRLYPFSDRNIYDCR